MDQLSFFGTIIILGLVNLSADLLALFSPYLATSPIGNVGPIFVQKCDSYGRCQMIAHDQGTGFIIGMSIAIAVTIARVIAAYHTKIADPLLIIIGWAFRLTVVIFVSLDLDNPIGQWAGLKGSHSYFYYIATLVIDGLAFLLVITVIHRERQDSTHQVLVDEATDEDMPTVVEVVKVDV